MTQGHFCYRPLPASGSVPTRAFFFSYFRIFFHELEYPVAPMYRIIIIIIGYRPLCVWADIKWDYCRYN